MMMLKKKQKQLLKKLWVLVRIILTILIAIGIFRGLRWMGLKGLFGMIIGMITMFLLLINKRTSFIMKFLIKALRGEEDLIEYLKNKKEKEDEYIEIKR